MKKTEKEKFMHLQEKAEELLNKKSPNSGSQLSEPDILKLFHELQVHQIELEIQKEELILAKIKSDEASDKYTELFDFNPTGYFLLSKEGIIIELNFSGAKILGKERSLLMNSRFQFFVSEKSKLKFNQFLENIFSEKKKISTELTLSVNGGSPVYIYLTGNISGNEENCLLSVTDITDRKQVELELRQSEEKWHNLFNILPVGVSIVDSQNRCTELNSALSKILDISEEGILKGEYKNRRYLRSDKTEMPPEEFPSMRSIREQKNIFETEIGVIKEDGNIIWTRVNAAPLSDGESTVTVTVDITGHKLIEKERILSQEKLRDFAAMLQQSREEERKSIAREIHDEFGQVLTAIKMNLTMLGNEVSQTEKPFREVALMTEINNMKNIIDHTIQKVRTFTNKLRPDVLDTFGLIEALESQISEFSKQYNLRCSFEKSDEEIAIDNDKSIAVYRIVQEALTNIARHAHATEVKVILNKTGNTLSLSVEDNGIGMADKPVGNDKGFGITGMKERAYICGGSLTVSSYKNKGTKIELTIPIE